MTLEELQIKFTAETSGIASQMSTLKNQLGTVETSAVKTQSAFSKFAKMGLAIGGAMIARELFQIGKESLAMANDAIESDNLFKIAMGGMEKSARGWSESLSQSLGLNAVEVRKNVGVLNTMFGSMGLNEQQAYDMSTSMVELKNDMSSFYNVDPEEMMQKLTAGITGETEPLKRIGILVDEVTISQYAMKNGISATGKEMTQQQKLLARYGAIMQQTKLAQGDLARTIDSPVNQLRKMNAQLDAAKIALGTALQPALLAILPGLTQLAIGAGKAINALNGTGEAGRSAFDDIDLSIAQAKAIAASSISTETAALVTLIGEKKVEVDAALANYATAAAETKTVLLTLELSPQTTGEERITTKLTELHDAVKTYATDFTTPVNAYLEAMFANKDIDITELNKRRDELNKQVNDLLNKANAFDVEIKGMLTLALADGAVSPKEIADISKKIDEGAGGLVSDALKNLKVQTDRIRLDIQRGDISVEGGEVLIDEMTAATNEAIGTITTLQLSMKAEVSISDWTSKTISSDDRTLIAEAVAKEINAGKAVIVAAKAVFAPLWAGTGAVGDAVTAMFLASQTAATNSGQALNDYVTAALTTGTTIDPAVLNSLREKYYSDMASITGGAAQGKFNRAAFDMSLTPESMTNLTNAYAESQKGVSEGQASLREFRLNDLFSRPFVPTDEFKTLQDAVDSVNKLEFDAIQANADDMVTRAAAAIIPQANQENLAKMDYSQVLDLQKSMDGLIASINPEGLSTAAKAQYDSLVNLQTELQAWSDYIINKNQFPEANLPVPGEIPVRSVNPWQPGNVPELGPIVMPNKFSNPVYDDGHYGGGGKPLTRAQYDKILGAGDSRAALQSLVMQFQGKANEAALAFINGMLAKSTAIETAGRMVTDGAAEGAYFGGAGMDTKGAAMALLIAEGLMSQDPAVRAAALALIQSATPIGVDTKPISAAMASLIAQGLASQNPAVRAAALALIGIATPPGVDTKPISSQMALLIAQGLASQDPAVRAATIALIALATPTATNTKPIGADMALLIAQGLTSQNPAVVAAALALIAAATPGAVDTKPTGAAMAQLIADGLKSKDPVVRAAANALLNAPEMSAETKAALIALGIAIGSGIETGIKATEAAVAAAAAALVDAARKKIKTVGNIESPSKVTKSLGAYFGEGFAIGIADSASMVSEAAKRLAGGAANALAGVNLARPSMSLMTVPGGGNQNMVITPQTINVSLTMDEYTLGKATVQAMQTVSRAAGGTVPANRGG